jgi:hypothetical protein
MLRTGHPPTWARCSWDHSGYVVLTNVSALLVVAALWGATAVPAAAIVNQPIAVAVSPGAASISSGETQQFSATITNTSETAVTWKTSVGEISSTGLYTAPEVTAATTCVVTATSVADPTKSAITTVTIAPVATLEITTTSLPDAVTGTHYSTTLAAKGGTPPYTWGLSTQWGSMPTGFSMSAKGVISGTTVQTGPFTLYVNVTDSQKWPKKAKAVLILTVDLNLTTNVVPANLFNMHVNQPATPWPSASMAGERLWDAGVTWSLINTDKGVYDWTLLDQRLADAKTHNADLLYNLGMTPVWAQCGKSTSSSCTQTPGCANGDVSWGGGPGQCYWPSDLNRDGTGTNQHWKDWVTAVANHSVNSNTAHIKYYEIWNEPNGEAFWRGTTAQMVRMAQDAACIIKGIGPGCKNTPIDPKAQMVTPAPTYGGSQINSWMTDYLDAGGMDISDVIAFHGYNGSDAEKIVSLVNTLRDGALTTYKLTGKPLFDTEFSWSENVVFPDPDEQAGFVARSMLLHWSAGVSRVFWYAWDISGTMWSQDSTNGCTIPDPSGVGFTCKSGTAFAQVQQWMVGATLSQTCSAVGTRWTCGFKKPGGYQALAVWDTSKSCNHGSCSTSTFTFPPVTPNYIHYRDLSGNVTKISGKTVPVGYRPILLENQ